MEAVPRLPMLKFDAKACVDHPVFASALKKYIRDHYNEDPASYTSELQELEQLRSSITFFRQDYSYCALLQKYFCQIRFLLSRFPISDANSELIVTFHWKDVYSASIYEIPDVNHEQAGVLYNIAIYHMTEGAAQNRSTPEGMRHACTHFQCAAWAYQYLRDTFPQTADCDLSPALMSFMHTIALAQAQECILEKSITDNRKPNIIAKVAIQVVEYLRTAARALDTGKNSGTTLQDIVSSKRVKAWSRYCQIKQLYYNSVTQLYLGLQAEELQRMGERLAYYTSATEKLAEATKLAKNMDGEAAIRDCFTFSHDVMFGKMTAAQKENEFVYHEKVPDVSTLPEVKGASLVKGIQFSFTDPDVTGSDIFKKLIPMKAHQASSLYSEEKASLLRSLGVQMQEKNDELEAFLASLQLEDLLLEDDPDALPPELVSACADLNSRDVVKELTDLLSQVSGSHLNLTQLLSQHKTLLEEEDQKNSEFLHAVGESAPPSGVVVEVRREGDKYRSALTTAEETNDSLRAAVARHRPSLDTLSKPLQELAASLPSVTQAVEQTGESGSDSKAQILLLMKQVEEMQQHRWSVEKQLRQSLMEDDITGQLITAAEGSDMQDLFREHLKKHDPDVKILKKNMSDQSSILSALAEANAAYAGTRRASRQASAARQAAVQALLQAYRASTQLLDNCREACAFYEKITGQVTKLLKRTESILSVQEEERQGHLSAQAKKFTAFSKSSKGATSQASSSRASGPDSSACSTHTLHFPLASTTEPSFSSGGLKLKDFLQAGGGFKSLSSMTSGSHPATGGYPAPPTTTPHSYLGGHSYQPNTTVPSYDSSGLTSGTDHPSSTTGACYAIPHTSPVHQNSGGSFLGSYQQQLPTTTTAAGYPASYPPSAPPPAPSPAVAVPTLPQQIFPSQPMAQQMPQSHQFPQSQQLPQLQPISQSQPMALSHRMPQTQPVSQTQSISQPQSMTISQHMPQFHSQPVPQTHLISQPKSMPQSHHDYQSQPLPLSQQVPQQMPLSHPSTQLLQYQYSPLQHPQVASVPSYTGGQLTYPAPQTNATAQPSSFPTQPPPSQQQQQHSTPTRYSESPVHYPSYQQPMLPQKGTIHPQQPIGSSQPLPQHAATSQFQAVAYSPEHMHYLASKSSALPSQQQYSNTIDYYVPYSTPSAENMQPYSYMQNYPNSSFTPNQYPSGTGMYTPSMSMSMGMKTSLPSYTPSSTFKVTTSNGHLATDIAASLTTPIPTASNSIYAGTNHYGTDSQATTAQDAIYYRYPSAAFIPSFHYAQAGKHKLGESGSMTPSSVGSPVASPGCSFSSVMNGYPQSMSAPAIAVSTSIETVMANQTSGAAANVSQYPFGYQQVYASSQAITPYGHLQHNQHDTALPSGVQPYYGQQQPPQVAVLPSQGQTAYDATPTHAVPAQPKIVQQPSPAVGGSTNESTSSTKGISNLDLLSGIELAGPSSMWTPLKPIIQSTSSELFHDNRPIVSKPATANPQVRESSTSSAPDITNAIKSSDNVSGAGNGTANLVASAVAPLIPADGSVAADAAPAVATVDSATITTTNMATVSDATSPQHTAIPSSSSASSVLGAAVLAKSKKPSSSRTVADPLDDPAILCQLVSDTERLHKTVETLDRRSLNGPTHLEMRWREVQDAVEARCKGATVSVSRCYPLKNRFPDVLAYDHSRVILSGTKDDYINASHVLVSGPHSFPMVISQAPTAHTACDYWHMVWQLQTELIVCLHTLPEIKNASYWPVGKGNEGKVHFGALTVMEQNSGEGGGGAWQQRLLHLTNTGSGGASTTRALIHLQFLGWPPGGMPSSPASLLALCSESLSLQSQQRNKQRPVLLTCVPGVGRSCVTAMLLMLLSTLHSAGSLCEVPSLCVDVCAARRGGLQDKDYLLFLYSAALYAAQDTLMKRGILTNKATFEEGPREKSSQHVRHPSADFLSTSCDFNRLKTKLGLGDDKCESGSGTGTSEVSSRKQSVSSTPEPPSLTGSVEDSAVADVATANTTPRVTTSVPADAHALAVSAHSASESSSSHGSPRPDSATSLSGLPLTPNLAASLDPQQLKIEPAAPGKGEKITKESFDRRGSGGLSIRIANPDDPFSSLDPLWTLKKS